MVSQTWFIFKLRAPGLPVFYALLGRCYRGEDQVPTERPGRHNTQYLTPLCTNLSHSQELLNFLGTTINPLRSRRGVVLGIYFEYLLDSWAEEKFLVESDG